MIKLTKREWDTMGRPVFPDIQFTSGHNKFQLQTMLKVGEKSDIVSYYIPYIRYREINNIEELKDFVKHFEIGGFNYINGYIIDEETDTQLYKVMEE